VSIQPPSEGSLDYEQFTRLFEQLAAVSVDGAETECWCFYAPAASHDWDHPTVYRCVLRLLAALYEDEEDGSPSNIWPVDRSWFVYTDADLWGTKISGSHELISCLVADDELETVELGF